MSDSGTSKGISHWLQGRVPQWRRIEQLVARQRGRRDETCDEVLEMAQGYRSLARDVSLARQTMPASPITRYLEEMLAACYDLFSRTPHSLGQQLVSLYRDEVPAVVRELRRPIAISATIFIVSAMLGWLLVRAYPEMVALFASEQMIETVQRGQLWTDDLLNVTPSSVLAWGIMTNNIAVTLFAFVFGSIYGLGTLYLLSLNGMMLGGVFAFTARYDLDGRLFAFIIGHGVVELSIIVLAGAAGIKLGEALIRPGQRTRVAAFQYAVSRASKLIAVGVPLLVGAGLIEGYISPNPNIPLNVRVTVGLTYGVFMLLVLSGRIWPRRSRLRMKQ